MAVKKMDEKQWREYVQQHLDEHKVRRTHFYDSLLQVISVSLIIGIIASALVIWGWGFREWTRMMLQFTLGITLATTVIATVVKRLEKGLGK